MGLRIHVGKRFEGKAGFVAVVCLVGMRTLGRSILAGEEFLIASRMW